MTQAMSAHLTIDRLQRALGGDANGAQLLCPGPGHSVEDRSLSVKIDPDAPDGFLVKSFADDDPLQCKDYVRKKLGLPEFQPKPKAKRWTVITSHIYRTATGEPFLRVQKCLDAAGRKQYPQEHWDGRSWLRGKPAGAKIPYRLPELTAAPMSAPVYFVEGERDADNLAKLGFIATTASEGAAARWAPALTEHFKDRRVVVLPDADNPGRTHAQKVARALSGIAASLKVIDLFPDRKDGSDVTDWLVDDPAGVRLVKLTNNAALWEPNTGDEEVIAELAALSRVQYEKRRKEEADKLGMRVAFLDEAVGEQRKHGEEEANLYSHWAVEPAEGSVDGHALLEALVRKIRRYVVMSSDQAVAVALWVIFTWIHERAAVHSPILLLTSAEANSGKSTLADTIGFLVRRSLPSVSISGPALFRSIEKWTPTIVIDEADKTLANNDDLRSIINSSWTRGQCVVRCDPETNEPRPYSTFAPIVVAMKGRALPDTTLTRSIIIELKRKRADETAADFDHLDDAEFTELRRQLLRWADDNAERWRPRRRKRRQDFTTECALTGNRCSRSQSASTRTVSGRPGRRPYRSRRSRLRSRHRSA
jgi:5S rRNA maturation endonuclease (ribonuclease M5)